MSRRQRRRGGQGRSWEGGAVGLEQRRAVGVIDGVIVGVAAVISVVRLSRI